MKIIRNLLVTLTSLLLVSAIYAADLPKLEPTAKQRQVSRAIIERLIRLHYVRHRIDDALSAKVFDAYLKRLDPQKLYFTEKDMQNLRFYRQRLDDALKESSLTEAFMIFNLSQERYMKRMEYYLELLEEGVDRLDLESDEQLLRDRSDASLPRHEADLYNLWEKRLRSEVVDRLLDDESFEEIEETLTKRYKSLIKRAGRTNATDVFQAYMNSLGAAYDPHTNYYSPRATENFNINMSLSLEGIGAILRQKDDYTVVDRLIPAGPALKGGELKPADRILAVGQGEDGDLIDVVGWRLDDVVDKIRGPKGSTVVLKVETDGEAGETQKLVRIVRDTIKLEEQSAQGEILEYQDGQQTQQIGVINLPAFYADFQAMREGKPDYRSTTRDVKKLLEEFVEKGVDGVIVDLRGNGGGSLQEASSMVGLFIPAGPTVQVRNSRNRVRVHSDDDYGLTYSGPLAVLTDRLSASASEIFAGAIQDYGRGLIVGTNTFGKGTVQMLVDMGHGQLKLTQEKFYRISGQSTQNRGVAPDIQLPSRYDPERFGESSLDDALPWDEIRSTVYHRDDSVEEALPQLLEAHQLRTADDPDFVYLRSRVTRRETEKQKNSQSLNLEARRAAKEEADHRYLEQKNALRAAHGKPLASSVTELKEMEASEEVSEEAANESEPAPNAAIPPQSVGAQGTAPSEENTEQAHSPQKEDDVLLWETGNILRDYIQLGTPLAAVREEESKSAGEAERSQDTLER